MRSIVCCAILGVFFLNPAETRASGLIQKLPKDGSWVRYHVDMKMAQIQNTEYSGTMTIRSVGRETVNDEPCRWIELELKAEAGERKINSLSKILVLEKVFDQEKNEKIATEKLIRGWEKTNENNPRKLKIDEISTKGLLSPWLPESSGTMEPLKEKKVINYQKGKLEIESGITGSLLLDYSDNPGLKIKTSIVYFFWTDEIVPFGTAAFKWDATMKRDEKVQGGTEMTFTLEDFGTGAKSALPEHN